MLIVGAKGFAKEVLEILHQNKETENLCFYDDVSVDFPDILYNKFRVLKNEENVKKHFAEIDKRFTIGIGNPTNRYKMYLKFSDLGGVFTSTISKNTDIASFGVKIGDGCNILSGVVISNDVIIKEGTIIYYHSIITHDIEIGKFCEISPNVKLLGRSKIGDFVKIGSGAIIFPDVVVGNNTIIAAGSVVRESIPDNVMVAGIPAVIKKTLENNE